MTGSWHHSTRDRSFYVALMASTLMVGWLIVPYIDVLLFSAVLVAVVWPWQQRLSHKLGGRRLLAALILCFSLALLVFTPLGALAYVFVSEGIVLARHGLEWVRSGQLDAWAIQIDDWLHGPWIEALRARMPPGTEPVEVVLTPLRNTLATMLGMVSNGLPSLLGSVVNSVIDVVIFLFAVVTLLADGPKFLRFIFDLSPLDDSYERRLVGVFQELSTNLVVGGFMTAVAQGVVAALGLWLFGVPRPLFFGVMTAVASFIPVVGTAMVLVPAAIFVGAQYGVASVLGFVLYSVIFTGSVDNLLRPLFMRGSSEIHPLMIFLAIFGGMAWVGLAGVLIGPVIVAVFLALATIHREDFLYAASPASAQSQETAD